MSQTAAVRPVSPRSLVGLFGVVPDHLGLTRAQSNSVAFLTLLARRLILIKWKDCKPPRMSSISSNSSL